GIAHTNKAALSIRENNRFRLMDIMAIFPADLGWFAPRFWAIKIAAPCATKPNITMMTDRIWLITPTTATDLSEYLLSINVSALPINICNNNSMKMGQVRAYNVSFFVLVAFKGATSFLASYEIINECASTKR